MNNEVEQQYRAVRETQGWMERADVGRLAIRGEDRFTWLQGMVSNDVRLLEKGTVRRLQACVLDATGHVLTDLTLINWGGEQPFVLAEMPLQNLARIAAQFDRYIIMEDVEIEDVTEKIGCLTLQGPETETEMLQSLASTADLNSLSADHTGSSGFDLYFFQPEQIKPTIQSCLSSLNLAEIGQEAQEILRIEAGIPKFGAELDESVIALEANIGPTHISLTKGCYVGQEIMARIDSRGHTNRALTGLLVTGETLPHPGDKIYLTEEDGSERETGRITSVLPESPALQYRPIALGYVRHEHRAPGAILKARGADRETILEVRELPFYRMPGA